MPRILGVDYGERRLGFALSDSLEQIATPFRVERIESAAAAVRVVKKVCEDAGAARIVIGLPVNMNGSRGPQAQRVEQFAVELAAATGLPVDTWDERLSTREAEQVLLSADTSRRRRREVIDKLAAQLVLQNYLDARQPPPEVMEP